MGRSASAPPEPEQVRVIDEAFRRADRGAKGWLTRDDLQVAAVGVLGHTLPQSDVDVSACARVTTFSRRARVDNTPFPLVVTGRS